MQNHIDHPLTVTVEEAAKLLGIGRSTAYELVHTGDIPSLRLGRRLVVPVAQIAEQLGVGSDAVWFTLTGATPAAGSPSAAGTSSTRGRLRGPSRAPEVPALF